MAIDAFIHLDRLRCISEHDHNGHSEPYVWTVLLWLDDTTISSSQLLGSSAPSPSPGFRSVIKAGIRAGEQAPIPRAQRSFAHRFEDDHGLRAIGIVVAMWEEDDTPEDSARAAYRVFVRELPRAVGEALVAFRIQNGRNPETDDEWRQIRQEVEGKLRPQIRSAIESGLSRWEKIQAFLGNLDFDDQLGFDNWFSEIDDDPPFQSGFTLRFEKSFTETVAGRPVERVNHYEVDGRFELREPPVPDPCQTQIDRVRQARSTLEGIEADIRSLQAELQTASPSEKADINLEIRRLRNEEIPGAAAALQAAQRALDTCRERQNGHPPLGGRVIEVPTDSMPVATN
jgi:hypothetical protein